MELYLLQNRLVFPENRKKRGKRKKPCHNILSKQVSWTTLALRKQTAFHKQSGELRGHLKCWLKKERRPEACSAVSLLHPFVTSPMKREQKAQTSGNKMLCYNCKMSFLLRNITAVERVDSTLFMHLLIKPLMCLSSGIAQKNTM